MDGLSEVVVVTGLVTVGLVVTDSDVVVLVVVVVVVTFSSSFSTSLTITVVLEMTAGFEVTGFLLAEAILISFCFAKRVFFALADSVSVAIGAILGASSSSSCSPSIRKDVVGSTLLALELVPAVPEMGLTKVLFPGSGLKPDADAPVLPGTVTAGTVVVLLLSVETGSTEVGAAVVDGLT